MRWLKLPVIGRRKRQRVRPYKLIAIAIGKLLLAIGALISWRKS